MAVYVFFLLALLLPLGLPTALPNGLLLVACGFALATVTITQRWRRHSAALAMGSLCACLAIGSWQARQLPAPCYGETLDAFGTIVAFPREETYSDGAQRQRFLLQLETPTHPSCANARLLQVSYWSDYPQVRLGDRIRASIRLKPVPSQWNDGQIPDQSRYVARGIDALGTVNDIVVEARDYGGVVSSLRLRLGRYLDQITTTPRVRGIARALLVGDGGAIASADWQLFRALGLSHLMVISGLHVGLVFGLSLVAARSALAVVRLGGRQGQRIALLMGLGAAASYAVLAGLSLPTQRALLMLLGLCLPRLAGWYTPPVLALLWAVAVILALDPFAVLSSSLWFSAGATALLVTQQRRFQGFSLPVKALLLQGLMTLALLPLSLLWFSAGSLAAVVANLLLVMPVALLLVPALLLGAVIAPSVTPDNNPLWLFATMGIRVFLDVSTQLAAWLPQAVWIQSSLSIAQVFGLVSWLGLAIATRRKAARIRVALLFLGATAVYRAVFADAMSNQLIVLDVGQGLAVLWREQGHWLLYDTGAGRPEGFSQTAKVILPYLLQRGVSALDTLIVSHGDNDHSGGIRPLLDRLPVARHYGFEGKVCRVGQRLPWPGRARITVLNGPGFGDDSNDGSCVLMIDYRGFRVLLAGDISRSRERHMVRYWREQLQADVLIAAHHGSQSSSSWTWLKWVQPALAVISSGLANPFGHPHPSVLARFEQAGIAFLDTREVGSIALSLPATHKANGRAKAIIEGVQTARGDWAPFWLSLP